jgi:hypothetical protein
MRNTLQRKLKQLENISPAPSPSITTPKTSAFATSYLDHRPTASDLNQRRQYQRSPSVDDGSSNISQVAALIESGDPLDLQQVRLFLKADLFFKLAKLPCVNMLAAGVVWLALMSLNHVLFSKNKKYVGTLLTS